MIIPSSKSYFWNILFPYPQLMIPGSEIDLRKELSFIQLVKQIIYVRERVFNKQYWGSPKRHTWLDELFVQQIL
jgi:hypothetical protein